MPSSNNDGTPKDFFSVTIPPKSPSTLTLLSKPGAKDTFIPVAITQAITKKKIKTFKSNNVYSIDGSNISIAISPNLKPPPRKIFPASISLPYIGASETIFEIRATFADKSYPSTPIPPGNINPVRVASRRAALSHQTKLVAECVVTQKTYKYTHFSLFPLTTSWPNENDNEEVSSLCPTHRDDE